MDFAKVYSAESFNAEIQSLMADIPKLSDTDITFRLMRLVATPNIGHTTVAFPTNFGFFRRLPLTLYWYADGLGIASAAPEYADAIGARVLKIGAQTPEDVLAALSPYIPHENDVWLRELAPRYMVTLAVVQHLNLAETDGSVTLTLGKPDRARFTMSVAVGDPRVVQTSLVEALHLQPPLFEVGPAAQYYSFRYLTDSKTLYIQYNRCDNDPNLPFRDFVSKVFAQADEEKPKKVIVDLRRNSGGNSQVIRPLKSELESRRLPVYVLIGPTTFSSAIINAVELRKDLHATLIGAPVGEKLNSYGEVRILTLPNSQLRVQYTTKYFRLSPNGESDLLDPDVPAPFRLKDMIEGRDPAVAAAIAAH